MLEADAKKKLCPFKFAHPLAINTDDAHCEGSDCMAWGWWEPKFRLKADLSALSDKPVGAPPKIDAVPERYEGAYEEFPRTGYCGMKAKDLECQGGY